jgi:hypothetical protein
MNQLYIPCQTDEVSDGYHTFGELYEHRTMLFLAFMKCMHTMAWYSTRHHDDSAIAGWFIAGVDLHTGTITYHVPYGMREALKDTGAAELEKAPMWDNHTSQDVLKRLDSWVHGVL